MEYLSLPNISQYADSIANPSGLTRTLGMFEAERDAYRRVRIRSGNNAAVFRINRDGQDLMLKCYITQGAHSEKIYRYISGNPDPLLAVAGLLKEELYVYDSFHNGRFYDIVVSEWVDGDTLETAIRFAVQERDTEKLAALSAEFDRMAKELLAREWAHGDLKPENIIVCPGGGMKLIDYDAMFIPELAGEKTAETGTPGYQHPARDENIFDKSIDDYPAALISASLRALAKDPSLYDKYHRLDNIIVLHPCEIMNGRSGAYDEILDLFIRDGDHMSYHLARQLKSPTPAIPGLIRILDRTITPDNYGGGELFLFEKGGQWGYRNQAGETIIEPIYDEATEFSEGVAIVKLKGIIQGISASGEVIVNDRRFEVIKPFSCGLAAVRMNGKWGFISHDGSIMIRPSFEDALSMREGMAAVLCATDENGRKWGYIGTDGEMVINPRFDRVSSFRNGTATAHTDPEILQIDPHGNNIRRLR